MDADLARTLLEANWLVLPTGSLLHYAALSEDDLLDLEDQGYVDSGRVTLACSRSTSWAGLPGLFTRMGAARCSQCCRALSCPQGVGSPKNDPSCSSWLASRS